MNPKDPLLHPDLLQDCLSLTKDTIDTFQKIKQKRSAMISPIQTLGQGLHKHSTMPKQDNAPQITDEMLDDFRKSKYFSFMDGPYKMIKAWEEFKSSYSVSSSGKDWEIVEFKDSNEEIYTEDRNGKWTTRHYANPHTEKELLDLGCGIFKIKRLSDNSIWIVGDTLNDFGTITKFKIQSDKWMVAHTDSPCGVFIEDFKKAPIQEKPVLFITEDGQNIIEWKTTIFSVRPDSSWSTTSQMAMFVKKMDKHWKHFSSKDERGEYILLNKPMLSISDVQSVYSKDRSFVGTDFLMEGLKKLAQQRIQGGKE